MLFGVAVRRGDLDLVQRLPTPQWNYVDLGFAVWQGHSEVVQYLLDRLNGSEDVMLATCLLLAIHQDRLELVRALLNKNNDLLTKILCNGFAPVHLAAMQGRTEILRFLIHEGVDVNRTRYVMEVVFTAMFFRARNPLSMAALQGQHKCVQLLLENGADASGLTITPSVDEDGCIDRIALRKYFSKSYISFGQS